jgi:hypothetical protein
VLVSLLIHVTSPSHLLALVGFHLHPTPAMILPATRALLTVSTTTPAGHKQQLPHPVALFDIHPFCVLTTSFPLVPPFHQSHRVSWHRPAARGTSSYATVPLRCLTYTYTPFICSPSPPPPPTYTIPPPPAPNTQGVLAQTSRPWHKQLCFGPFALFDLHGKEDVPEGSASIVNRAEAEFVLCLYKHMLGQVQELQDGTASVAVISPYKAQVGVLLVGCFCVYVWG